VDEKMIVIDVGVSSLDIAVLQRSEEDFRVLSSRKYTDLSGQAIDELIVNYCIGQYEQITGI